MPIFNIIAELETAKASPNADQRRQDLSRVFLNRISWAEEQFILRRTPEAAYDEHVRQILSESPWMLGRFSDLKFLHNGSGYFNFRNSREFETALKFAVNTHRERFLHEREWSEGAGVLDTKPKLAHKRSQVTSKKFTPNQTANGSRYAWPAQTSQAGPKSLTTLPTSSTAMGNIESGIRAEIAKAGIQNLKDKLPTKFSLFSIANNDQASQTDTASNESPFARVSGTTDTRMSFISAPSKESATSGKGGEKQPLQMRAATEPSVGDIRYVEAVQAGTWQMPERYPILQEYSSMPGRYP